MLKKKKNTTFVMLSLVYLYLRNLPCGGDDSMILSDV